MAAKMVFMAVNIAFMAINMAKRLNVFFLKFEIFQKSNIIFISNFRSYTVRIFR